MQAKEPLQRVVSGQTISAADWNRVVDRVNAGTTGTIRATAPPTPRTDSQVVPVANVGKRDFKPFQPIFATGVLRIETRFASDGKPLSGDAELEAEYEAALNGAFVVETKDVPTTGESVESANGSFVSAATRYDLLFVALEPIPAGGVGRAIAACGPVFLAKTVRSSLPEQKYALPYANAVGHFYRSDASGGFRVVATTEGDDKSARRCVALLGYWQDEAATVKHSCYNANLLTSAKLKTEERNAFTPITSVKLKSGESDATAFTGVESVNSTPVALRFGIYVYDDGTIRNVKILVGDDTTPPAGSSGKWIVSERVYIRSQTISTRNYKLAVTAHNGAAYSGIELETESILGAAVPCNFKTSQRIRSGDVYAKAAEFVVD